MDVGPELKAGDSVGGLRFEDSPSPVSDYLGVKVDDELSASLLQHRLNELETGIAVEMID